MNAEFALTAEGVAVDLTPWTWLLALYLDDLDGVLGPAIDLPDHPLDALAATLADSPERPTDPTRARLLPDGVLDDPEAAAEFRRFTQTTLVERKRADLATLRRVSQAPCVVDPATARSVLGALNDLRLMLGTRLGVTEEGALLGDDDLQAYQTYGLFTYLQGVLVEVLMGEWGGPATDEPAP